MRGKHAGRTILDVGELPVGVIVVTGCIRWSLL